MQIFYWSVFVVFTIALITGVIAISGNAVDDDYESGKPASVADGLSIAILLFLLPLCLIKWSVARIDALDYSLSWTLVGVIFGAGVLVGTLGSLKVVRNHFVHLRAELENAANHIELIYERRFEQLSALIKMVRSHEEVEKEVIDRVLESQERIHAAGNADSKVGAMNEMDSRFRVLLTNATNLPNLKGDRLYLNVMESIDSLEAELIDAKERYNDIVTSYNQMLTASPNNLLAGTMKLEKAELFRTTSSNIPRNLGEIMDAG